jgi:hypothetical protein
MDEDGGCSRLPFGVFGLPMISPTRLLPSAQKRERENLVLGVETEELANGHRTHEQ